MISYLELDDLIAICSELNIGPIRDVGLLGTAAHRPQASAFGEDAYPNLNTKAAVLMESIARNRPLVDGNKRLAWVAMVVFYGLNDRTVDAPDDDAYDLVIGVATGSLAYDVAATTLAGWLRTY